MILTERDITDNINVNLCNTCKKEKKNHYKLLTCFKCHKPIHNTCGEWVQSNELEEAYYCCKDCAK